MSFWDTEEGRIMAHTIHEHNSGLGMLVRAIGVMRRQHERKGVTVSFINNKEKELYYKNLDFIEKGIEKCKESIDYAYKKALEKHESKKQ